MYDRLVSLRVQRKDDFFSIFVSSSQFIDPILNVTNKDVLTEEEVVQCQQVIYSIVALEARHEPLALPIGHRYGIFCVNFSFNFMPLFHSPD